MIRMKIVECYRCAEPRDICSLYLLTGTNANNGHRSRREANAASVALPAIFNDAARNAASNAFPSNANAAADASLGTDASATAASAASPLAVHVPTVSISATVLAAAANADADAALQVSDDAALPAVRVPRDATPSGRHALRCPRRHRSRVECRQTGCGCTWTCCSWRRADTTWRFLKDAYCAVFQRTLAATAARLRTVESRRASRRKNASLVLGIAAAISTSIRYQYISRCAESDVAVRDRRCTRSS